MEDATPMIWIADKGQVWCQAKLRSQNDLKTEYEVERTEGGQTVISTVAVSSTHPVDPSHLLDLDNLCLMNNMHEAPLLDLLRRRFNINQIYTLTGNVLISLNPYKTIDGIYDQPLSYLQLSIPISTALKTEKYMNAVQNITLSPHVFSVANRALSHLVDSLPGNQQRLHRDEVNPLLGAQALLSTERLEEEGNQSIVISGESGAGKTENSKYVMSFLIQANRAINSHSRASSRGGESAFTESLLAVLLESSVVLEAFGNAKTVRNDNSSRFGKYIKLMYSAAPSDSASSYTTTGCTAPELVSAVTDTFLLEKSRLVSVGKDERNYHIFYQLLRGLPKEDPRLCAELSLDIAVEMFPILVQGGCTKIRTIEEDATDFSATLSALRTLHCSEEEVRGVWSVLACLLHLSSLLCVDSDDPTSDPAIISSPTIELEQLAALLGLECSELLRCLTTQELVIQKRASIHVKVLSSVDVMRNILALVKWMYDKIFSWLVQKINFSHSHLTDTSVEPEQTKFIGILDIFGFEILGINSFEQLCINLTNERLQQQFNETVFVSEQEMYRAEGLQWDNITFRDNQHVIDLICSLKTPLGLLLILEEHCMLNRGVPDDNALLSSYDQVHEPIGLIAKAASAYFKPRFKTKGFVIRHFAGEVNYMVEGFLAKNNDAMQEDLMKLLKLSSSSFLRNTMQLGERDPTGPGYIAGLAGSQDGDAVPEIEFDSPLARTGKRAGSSKRSASTTVSQQFRTQLDALMKTLRGTRPHYIKCIKPNTAKAAQRFQSELVMEQLRYSGVLEVVRIRREGFPVRMSFFDFYRKNYIFATGKPASEFPDPLTLTDENTAKLCCARIASAILESHQFQLGTTLIFLRDDGLHILAEAVTDFRAAQAVKLQALMRGHLAWLNYQMALVSIVICQSLLRKFVQRQKFKRARKAVVSLQWAMLRHVIKKKFRIKRAMHNACAVKIQSIARMKAAKNELYLLHAAAMHIQLIVSARHRGYLARREFMRVKLAVLSLQLFFRHMLFRRMTQRLHASAARIQSVVRMRQCRMNFVLSLFATIRIQANVRAMQGRARYLHAILSILTMQHCWRLALTRKRYAHSIRSVVLIQSTIRRKIALSNVALKKFAIVKIQSHIRRSLEERRYATKLVVTVAIQALIRAHLKRRKFLKLKLGVIRMQSVVRARNLRVQQSHQLFSVITLQSFARRILAEKRYVARFMALATLQNAMRGWAVRQHYRCTLYGVCLIQSAIRGKLARMSYQDMRMAAIVVQSVARMIIAKRRCAFKQIAVIVVQSIARMHAQREKFKLLRFCAITIQSNVRAHQGRQQYALAHFSIVMLQAWLRCVCAKLRYKRTLQHINNIIKVVRRWKALRQYQAQKSAIWTIQKCLRNFLTHVQYKRELMVFHEVLMCEELSAEDAHRVSEGALLYVQNALLRRPQLLTIRNPWLEFCTCFHSAVLGGDVDLLRALQPGYRDLFEPNTKGSSAIHYLAERPNMGMLRAVLELLTQYKYQSTGLIRGLDDDDDEAWFGKASESQQQVSISLKETLHASVGKDTLKQGWLKKKRGGMMWQRRYIVLTEDYIIYYKSDQSLHTPKFAIPLDELTVQRLPGKDPILEIISPSMPEKKTMFGSSNKKAMLFMAESEQDLQEWLLPLKVIAGVEEDLRVATAGPSVSYVNFVIRQLWASQLDAKLNTALHILAGEVKSFRASPGHSGEELVQLAAWLIEHGCPVNAINNQGVTALHVCAYEYQTDEHGASLHRELMRCLILKGADGTKVRDSSGFTALDAIGASAQIPKAEKAHLGELFNSRIVRPTIATKGFGASKLKGYSYLSLYLSRTIILDEDSWKNPSVTFTVYNSAGQLIEKSQEVLQPALCSVDQARWSPSPQPSPTHDGASSTSVQSFLRSQNPHVALYWGSYWHMATPLQNLEAGSCVLIEVRDGSAEDHTSGLSNPTTFFTRYALDYATINSSFDQTFPLGTVQNGLNAAGKRTMLTHPVVPPLRNANTSTSKSSVSGSRPGSGVPNPLPTTSQLTVDAVLHRKDRLVAFEQIMAT